MNKPRSPRRRGYAEDLEKRANEGGGIVTLTFSKVTGNVASVVNTVSPNPYGPFTITSFLRAARRNETGRKVQPPPTNIHLTP